MDDSATEGQTPEAPKKAAPKKRPPPKKRRAPKRKPDDKEGVAHIANAINYFNLILAQAVHPIFATESSECEAIAKAIVDVQQEFDMSLSPKAQALSNLAIVVGMSYGAKILQLRMMMREERENAEKGKNDDD